jgi:hypothetical protein
VALLWWRERQPPAIGEAAEASPPEKRFLFKGTDFAHSDITPALPAPRAAGLAAIRWIA